MTLHYGTKELLKILEVWIRDQQEDLDWKIWPVCLQPGYYGGMYSLDEKLRWLAAHKVPHHLLEVFFTIYSDVEDYFSTHGYPAPPCALLGALCAPSRKAKRVSRGRRTK